MERQIKTVLVVGAGFMGTGIAQSTAQAGYETLLWAPDRSELDQSRDKIEAGLAKMAQQGKLKDGPEVVGQRVVETLELGDAAKADLVIETVVESLPIKTEVFKTLDRQAADRALLASNTSTIPITKLAALVRRPERVVGIHFSSPVPLMPVAEVIRTTATSEETFQRALAFVRSLGKEPIKVQRDRAGFVFNRVNLPSTVEAIKLVESGTATIEDVDKAMRLGFGRPMGPFETADMVGLDTGYYALLSMYEETKDPKFLPPDLLCQKVWLGHLGRKTGRGWYEYDANGNKLGGATT